MRSKNLVRVQLSFVTRRPQHLARGRGPGCLSGSDAARALRAGNPLAGTGSESACADQPECWRDSETPGTVRAHAGLLNPKVRQKRQAAAQAASGCTFWVRGEIGHVCGYTHAHGVIRGGRGLLARFHLQRTDLPLKGQLFHRQAGNRLFRRPRDAKTKKMKSSLNEF
jgi:hypothetical protein